MVEYHTVETLRDKLNELINQGYADFEVGITYDNGYGGTYPARNVEPKIINEKYGSKRVIFAEDDEFVRGFDTP